MVWQLGCETGCGVAVSPGKAMTACMLDSTAPLATRLGHSHFLQETANEGGSAFAPTMLTDPLGFPPLSVPQDLSLWAAHTFMQMYVLSPYK